MKLGAVVQARKPEAGKLIGILGHPGKTESQNNHVGMVIISNGHLGNAGGTGVGRPLRSGQDSQGHRVRNSFVSVMTTIAIVRTELWF